MLPHHCSTSKEVKTGNQRAGSCRQELMQKSGWVLLPGLLSMSCSDCFLKEIRTTSPWMAPPTMGWTLPYRSLIKKMSFSWILEQHFLNLGSLLSGKSNLCQVATNQITRLQHDLRLCPCPMISLSVTPGPIWPGPHLYHLLLPVQ